MRPDREMHPHLLVYGTALQPAEPLGQGFRYFETDKCFYVIPYYPPGKQTNFNLSAPLVITYLHLLLCLPLCQLRESLFLFLPETHFYTCATSVLFQIHPFLLPEFLLHLVMPYSFSSSTFPPLFLSLFKHALKSPEIKKKTERKTFFHTIISLLVLGVSHTIAFWKGKSLLTFSRCLHPIHLRALTVWHLNPSWCWKWFCQGDQ